MFPIGVAICILGREHVASNLLIVFLHPGLSNSSYHKFMSEYILSILHSRYTNASHKKNECKNNGKGLISLLRPTAFYPQLQFLLNICHPHLQVSDPFGCVAVRNCLRCLSCQSLRTLPRR